MFESLTDISLSQAGDLAEVGTQNYSAIKFPVVLLQRNKTDMWSSRKRNKDLRSGAQKDSNN
ncbi:hypothetical protein T265_02165 [Opisthorchis viverrini]|uniref:Uncharacterized protein n=1 Tax=Opisthorchis viverrini TaxID=6198 RepID=A0A075A7Q0_OPIVI|nr:hypothetical protein T265_02165 [Opisthorchis viverrini]KER31660.1 hypothetical protein T265_02165 [Opisthorchis viverrini]